MSESETQSEPDDEEESSPAEDFALRLGLPLALVAFALAFIGPAPLLETSRFELPVLASFREPFQTMFFAYVGAVTFAFALFGALTFPSLWDEDQEGYEGGLAISLIIPSVGIAVVLAILGAVFPALYYFVTGQLVQGALVLVGAVIIVAIGLAFETIAILVLAAAAAPLWLPSYLGAYAGGFLQRTVSN
jgi:hypothetical protein